MAANVAWPPPLQASSGASVRILSTNMHRCTAVVFWPSPELMRQEDARGGSTESENPNSLSVTALRAPASPPCQNSRRSGQERSSALGTRYPLSACGLCPDPRISEKQSAIGIPDSTRSPYLSGYSGSPLPHYQSPVARTPHGAPTYARACLWVVSQRLRWVLPTRRTDL